jgi:hypothetical protein
MEDDEIIPPGVDVLGASMAIEDEIIPPGVGDFQPAAEEEDKPSLISDVGRATITAPIEFGRGIAGLAALGLDSALDTDYSRDVTEFFDAADEYVGGPKTQAGEFTRDMLVFGLGFVPIAGWIGRAGLVAKTGKGLNATSKFMQSAEKFGAGKTGRALLGNRAKVLGATALASGAYDFAISDGNRTGVTDMIEFLPESLKTEKDTGLTGSAEASRQFRNRLRRASEASALGATFDTLLYGLGRGSRAIGESKIVGDPLSKAARATLKGWETLGNLTGRIPGAEPLKENLTRYFAPQGGLERRVARSIQEAGIQEKSFKQDYARLLSRFDRLAKDAAKKSVERSGRRDMVGQMEADLMRHVEFSTGDHLAKTYGKEFQEIGDEMRLILTQQQDNLFSAAEQVAKESPTVRGVAGIPEGLGPQRGAQSKKAQELLAFMKENNKDAKRHISRVYELYRNPAKLYEDLGGKNLMEDPRFKAAVDVLVRESGQRTPESVQNAQRTMLQMLNIDPIGGVLTPKNIEKAIQNRLKQIKADVVGDSSAVVAKRSPVFKLNQGILQNRVDLTKYAEVRTLLGEIKTPRERLGYMLDNLTELNTSLQFYKQQSRTAMPAGEALRAIGEGKRPSYVFLPGSGRDTMPEDRFADLSSALGKGASKQELVKNTEQLLHSEGYRKLGEENFDDIAGGSYGALSGMYVPEELYNTLTAPRQFGMNYVSQLGAILTQMKGLTQKMLIVPNPASRVRDFIGGKLMKIGSGNASSGFGQTDGQIAYNVFRNLYSDDPAIRNRMMRILSLAGVSDSSVALNAIESINKGASDYGAIGAVKKGIEMYEQAPLMRPVLEFFEKTTAGVDTLAKAEVFFAEKSKLEEFLGAVARNTDEEQSVLRWLDDSGLVDRTKSELGELRISQASGTASSDLLTDVEVIAADLTRRVMPTYGEIGLAVREADRLLPFGNFVSFASETIRNMGNILELGIKGLALEADDQLIAEIGKEAAERAVRMQRGYAAQRLTGLLTVSSLVPKSLVKFGQDSTGLTDEQMDRLHEQVDFFQKGQDIVPLEFDGEGKIKYLNLSYVAPYSFVTDAAQAALREYQERGRLNQNEAQQILGGGWEFIRALADPFTAESMFYERVRDALPSGGEGGFGLGRGGQTQTGARIYEPTDSYGSKVSQGFLHVFDALVPGMAKLVIEMDKGDIEPGRLTRAMLNIPGSRSQEYDVQEELGRQITGFTPMTLDLKRDAEFAARAYAPARSNTKTKANREILRGDSTPESISRAWGGYLDDLYREQSKLYNEILAFRELGLSDQEIRRNFVRKANLGTKEVNSIMRGEFYPGSVSAEIRKDVNDQVRAEGRRRLTTNVNWGELNRMSSSRRGEELDPELFRVRRQQDTEQPVATPLETQDEMIPPGVLGVPAQAAPATMAPATTPAAPAAPAAPQVQPAPSPGLLGTNPVDQLRNLELFNRLNQ